MDFKKSIFENRKERSFPFLAAHRGVCGANVPCNTMAAFEIAIKQGADVVELDVSKSIDGKYFVFHPGMEPVYLGERRRISEMTAAEVEAMPLLNQDMVPTSYRVPGLSEVLAFLKGKAYINVDKFASDVKGISEQIRLAGVEEQVIVKTSPKPEYLEQVKKYAADFMFVPMVRTKDEVTDMLIGEGVNVIGAEILFSSESEEVISDAYIRSMHDRRLLIWANSIVYNEKDVISAYHTDDLSLTDSPERGWGWLIDKQVDFIQTDWLLMLKEYLKTRA